MNAHVIVWADGKIEFYITEPKGGISIATVENQLVAFEAIEIVAEKTENGYYAPEVQKAYKSGGDRVKALWRFQDRFKAALAKLEMAGSQWMT